MAVRVLLCGMGGYGENYVKEYLTRDVLGSELVAIADPFASKSPLYEEVVAKGIPLFGSPEEFFAQNSVDLTIISSPIHTHYPYVMLALEKGSNVLTEKPVCFDESQIDAMEAKSRETGLFVAVGYQLCFSRDVIAMKQDILCGVYGKPTRFKTIRLMRRNDVYYNRSNWAGALLCHGEKVFDSPFTNACAHQYQNMVYLLGKDMDASATSCKVEGSLIRVRPTITNCDTAILKFTTVDGVELYYYSSHAVDEVKVGPDSIYEFDGGYIEEVSNGFVGHTADGKTIDYSKMDKGERLEKLWESVRCVQEGRTPSCTLRTSREHTHAVLMAQEKGVIDYTDCAQARKDDKDSIYYTVPGMGKALQDAYKDWSIDLNLINWETKKRSIK
ncbi:MAG: Gfo/Idh/MocA family oxidoreductase [Sphaerochaetaceae bacterium]|nr:Gfo/Idh/MocA family oxidoreductase [Sphaerochaetaceae bacterium]